MTATQGKYSNLQNYYGIVTILSSVTEKCENINHPNDNIITTEVLIQSLGVIRIEFLQQIIVEKQHFLIKIPTHNLHCGL